MQFLKRDFYKLSVWGISGKASKGEDWLKFFVSKKTLLLNFFCRFSKYKLSVRGISGKASNGEDCGRRNLHSVALYKKYKPSLQTAD